MKALHQQIDFLKKLNPKNLFIVFRSSIFFIVMVISAIVHGCLTLLLAALPFKKRYRFITLWCRFVMWCAKTICGITVQVEGKENIPNFPVVLACNHESMWETLSLQTIFPMQAAVVKKELLNIPFFGWGLRLLKPIAINRSTPLLAAEQLVNQGKQRLANGLWVSIFPQGTRVAPGEEGRFNRGAAVLAHAANCAILPVAHNAGNIWPRRSFLKKPGTIRLVIGPLISSDTHSLKELHQLSKEWIIEARAKLN